MAACLPRTFSAPSSRLLSQTFPHTAALSRTFSTHSERDSDDPNKTFGTIIKKHGRNSSKFSNANPSSSSTVTTSRSNIQIVTAPAELASRLRVPEPKELIESRSRSLSRDTEDDIVGSPKNLSMPASFHSNRDAAAIELFPTGSSKIIQSEMHNHFQEIDPRTPDASIPDWTTEDSPIWLSMFADFLGQRNPTCVLLDTDMQPLPVPIPESALEQNHNLSKSFGPNVFEALLPPSQFEFRYVHIPHLELRQEIEKKIHRSEPVAIFSGSTFHSSIQLYRLCNIH